MFHEPKRFKELKYNKVRVPLASSDGITRIGKFELYYIDVHTLSEETYKIKQRLGACKNKDLRRWT